MKRLFLVLLFLPSLAFAQDKASSHLWETAAFGEVPGLQHVYIEGWNPAITTTFEVMWSESAAYTPLTTAASTPYCASTSANDASAGTGARTISVTGLNTSFTRFTETVTLNGQTSVNLATTNVLFIDKITVLTAGSGLVNAGDIDCGTGTNTSGSAAVVHQRVPVSSATAIPAASAGGGNVSPSFMYGVPANKTLICRNIQCGSVFATAAAGHECVIDGYTESTGVLKRYFVQMQHNTGANPGGFPGLIKFPEKTLILGKMAGVTGTSTGPASMHAECLLIDNNWEDTAQQIF